jgi:flagellar FliL protein
MKKLVPVIVLALLAAGGAYKFALAKPAPKAKPKVAGAVYVLPKDFMLNLEGGRFAKLGVALVVEHDEAAGKEGKEGKGSAAAKPPDGYGLEPQEALVRSIVTDVVSGQPPERLQSRRGRRRLQEEILARLRKSTDVPAEEVVFTDVAVQ